VGGKLLQVPVKRLRVLEVDGVQSFRAVDGDRRNAVVALDVDAQCRSR
jgi:hypothetical protein